MKSKDKVRLLSKNKDFKRAMMYIDGVYMLHSIICGWWDESEDCLKKAGVLSFDFKHEFMATKRMMEHFERVLCGRVLHESKRDVLRDQDVLEPLLRKYFCLDEEIKDVE